jgi:putative ABC transport system substrate-binding protein
MGSVGSAEGQAHLADLRGALRRLGWGDERLVIENRWGEGRASLMRTYAEELVSRRPDVIVVRSATALREVRRVAGDTPIVFLAVSNPVDNGFVPNLAHPGGNITGFSNLDFDMAGKWLQLLKEIAPRLSRVLALQSANNPSWPGWRRAIESFAPALEMRVVPGGVAASNEIAPAIAAFAREPNGGMLVLPDPFLAPHRALVVNLAARHRLPTIYGNVEFVAAGGLAVYSADHSDLFKRAGVYVSRILNGEKPGELPVQAPTQFDLTLNLRTAKALGLAVPRPLLLRANRVIE